MLDLETLRVAESAVAACVFLLVAGGTFRTTRAPFAGWWSAALLASAATSATYLLAGDSESLTAAAVGNAFSVTGAALVWAAARSLRRRTSLGALLVAPGLAFGAATLAERPTGDAWPGGLGLLVGMGGFIGLGAVELWMLARARSRRATAESREVQAAVVSMAVASSAMAAFYGVRVTVYVSLGPSSDAYQSWAGPIATTFLMLVMLVVVTYAVSGLTQLEEASRWRAKASRDDLTGLLHRSAFADRAESLVADSPPERCLAAIVADLDHFKSVNDEHGHAAGDRVLVAFARSLTRALGPDDLAGRFGGEEFVVLLAEGGVERAKAVAARVDAAFHRASGRLAVRTTVSYGVAACGGGDDDLDRLVERADAALYRAKRAGRDRVVVDDDPDDVRV